MRANLKTRMETGLASFARPSRMLYSDGYTESVRGNSPPTPIRANPTPDGGLPRRELALGRNGVGRARRG
jgi:hypothetical protein